MWCCFFSFPVVAFDFWIEWNISANNNRRQERNIKRDFWLEISPLTFCVDFNQQPSKAATVQYHIIAKARKTETKTKKKFIKRVPIRHKEKTNDMAAQLALQRNFVTITPSNQISSTTTQTSQSTTTMATTTTNGEIVTITDANQISTSETNTAPIHIMQTHTQVNRCPSTPFSCLNRNPYSWVSSIHACIHSLNAIINFTEKVHLTNGHHIGRCFDYRCGSNRSGRFTGWSTNNRINHFADQFRCLFTK